MDERYYFEPGCLTNGIVKFSTQESRHMTLVRRQKIGDRIVAFCGDGYDYSLEIIDDNKNTARAKVLTKKLNANRPNIDLTVILGCVKNDALTTIVQNLTQLNVTNLVIFEADYSNAKISPEKIDKLTMTSLQSAKQCERADCLNISYEPKEQVLNSLCQYDRVLLAYENENLSHTLDISSVNKVAMVIGPEGGFSAGELDAFVQAGARTISLGKTILKAEVATTVLAGCIMEKCGEWHR